MVYPVELTTPEGRISIDVYSIKAVLESAYDIRNCIITISQGTRESDFNIIEEYDEVMKKIKDLLEEC